MQKNAKPKVISLFTCGMGMDIGFEKAGFETVYANDIERFAYDTIRKNKSSIPCDLGDITKITSEQIIQKAGLNQEPDVVIGGPPCQSFSTAGTRRGLEDKRGIALLEFIRVIKEVNPKFFVFENVPGLTSIAKKHIRFYDREAMDKSEIPEESKRGSLFREILFEFSKLKEYKVDWDILNAADYGVPQKRKRLILIGSRVADPKIVLDQIREEARFAEQKHNNGKDKIPWRTLKDALQSLPDEEQECTSFPSWGKFMKHVPPGGCWRDLPEEIRNKAMGGAADSEEPKRKGKQGGRTGFYRRLTWDKPSPTLVTSPSQLATCICHPDNDRPLTIREYARIQGFPDSWEFVGSTSQKYRMIGEAVPIELARIIASKVKAHI